MTIGLFMKTKRLVFFLLISSLFAYLEWGGGNSSFLFQMEWDIIKKMMHDPASILHPFTLLPMLGQSLLIISLFLKEPPNWILLLGTALIGLLLFFILLIGFLSLNLLVVISVLPFCVTSIFVIWFFVKKRKMRINRVRD